MSLKMFTSCIILQVFISLIAQDSLKISDIVFEENLNTPLFENSSPFWKDYRTNQSVQNSFKWASIGSVVCVAVLAGGSGSGNFIAYMLAFAGPPIGLIYGAYDGYFYGAELNEYKKSHPEFHLQRKHIGYEAEVTATTSNGLTFPNAKGYLCYQPLVIKKYMPSEYRFGLSFSRDVWLEDDDEIDTTPFYSYSENRTDLSLLYNSNKKYFQFHWGFGAGYSWGNHEIQTGDYIETYPVKGVFVYPLAGFTVNFNDFFYVRAEGRYELSQFYYELLEYADYPVSTNFSLGFSFGTYIF